MARYIRDWGTAAWAFGAVTLLLCALYAVAGQPAIAAEPKFPQLTGRVVDEAALLSAPVRDRITGWLAEFERASKRQLVVVTVKDLQGYPIEDFGYRLGRAWGIGQKDRNTGAIMLVAPKERTVRIEVGYGFEGELTDAISRAIIEKDILPAYRGSPIGKLLEYHNLDRPFETYTRAELLVGMCMDNRKALDVPENFAYILRTGCANMRARMSLPPPGDEATTSRIGRLG